MRKLILFFLILFCCTPLLWANEDLGQSQLVTQQINLLKDRLTQEQNELSLLQHKQDLETTQLSPDQVSKQLLNQCNLDIAAAQSDLDSINIEIVESQQTISRLEKDVQEIDNQLSVYNIFGITLSQGVNTDIIQLRSELKNQKDVLRLEKIRMDFLTKLQKAADNILQIYNAKYARIDAMLKSKSMLQLKEEQAKSELRFQTQQNYWLQKLNKLYEQVNGLDHQVSRAEMNKLQNEIFYVKENVNFTYLQILTAHYQEQLQQLKLSILRSTSITLLNKVSEQVSLLQKQLARVGVLQQVRIDILEKRKKLLTQTPGYDVNYFNDLAHLNSHYKFSMKQVSVLNQEVTSFRQTVNHNLHQELSSRQGLPAYGTRGWLDLGAELLLVPTFTFQVLKSMGSHLMVGFEDNDMSWWVLFVFLQSLFISGFYVLRFLLAKIISHTADHEYGHISLKWFFIKLLYRNLFDVFFISNIVWLLYYCDVPHPNIMFFVYFAVVWLFFKTLFSMARIGLIESVHDRKGRDVKLYHHLKWTFFIGGLITSISVLIHQLPVIYEVKGLLDRIFLSYVFIVSIFLLKSWEVVPGLILPHVDMRRTYLRRVIRLLGLLIPCILLINSLIGLCGFINLVRTMSWYESIFLMVLVGYLIIRGLLSDAMEFFSKLLIQHISNGWLWTEAFLKPIDRVLRISLFLSAWVILFLLYGWDSQSPAVERFYKLLNYRLVDVLNTTLTPWRIIAVTIILAFLYWAAKWTREFVYRFLLSRTKDLGIRNSIAILSQYSMIVIGFLICLRVLGIDFKALAVVAGMFGLGIGLGLRDIANNFVCGFLLLIERPLRVGDIVTIGGFEGDVIHIGGRAVTIRTWDYMDVLVPNAEIFSKTFTNWTARDNIVRTVINIKINRQDQPHIIQNIIYEVLKLHQDVLKDPAPEVFLKELMEGMIEFEIRYFINLRLVKSRIAVRSEILIAIWNAFKRHGIEPPYPHHEIFLRNPPALPAP